MCIRDSLYRGLCPDALNDPSTLSISHQLRYINTVSWIGGNVAVHMRKVDNPFEKGGSRQFVYDLSSWTFNDARTNAEDWQKEIRRLQYNGQRLINYARSNHEDGRKWRFMAGGSFTMLRRILSRTKNTVTSTRTHGQRCLVQISLSML